MVRNGSLAMPDWRALLILVALVVIGVVNLWSASQGLGYPYHQRQILWLGVGVILGLVAYGLDYRRFEAFAYFFYSLGIVLLVAVWFFGVEVGGAKRWIGVGGMRFQPSEYMKLALIVALARYFYRRPRAQGYSLIELLIPTAIALFPAALIALEPDLGTAVSMLLLFSAVVLFCGIRRRSFLTLLAILSLLAPAGWFVLKDYQRQRIIAFLDPYNDPLGSGYHLIQSKIAVGSGGLWGKGFLGGTQCKLQFLPQYHTDFAFALLGEEWGFVGCVVVLVLFMLLILWGFETAFRARDRFGAIMAAGVTAMFFIHVAVNVGMVLGLLPVVGLPLPFLSYGGSCTVVHMIGMGLLLNVRRRRHLLAPRP